MKANQNKPVPISSLIKEVIKDYPIVMFNQLKVSLTNISNIIILFSLPFIVVTLTGLIVFALSIVFVPLCITILVKPNYFGSKLKKELINIYQTELKD